MSQQIRPSAIDHTRDGMQHTWMWGEDSGVGPWMMAELVLPSLTDQTKRKKVRHGMMGRMHSLNSACQCHAVEQGSNLDLHVSEMMASINSGAAILAYRALAPLLHHLWSMYNMCNMSDLPDSASTRYNDLVLWDDWMVVWTPKVPNPHRTPSLSQRTAGENFWALVLLGNATVWPPQYSLDATIPLQFKYKLASHVEVSPE
ncbi:hypothetical protein EV363DRAFT_1397842 [Boletus edulis]|nr:hypothetical protein EV363DRAFT_1397842 [Boletus edulis]